MVPSGEILQGVDVGYRSYAGHGADPLRMIADEGARTALARRWQQWPHILVETHRVRAGYAVVVGDHDATLVGRSGDCAPGVGGDEGLVGEADRDGACAQLARRLQRHVNRTGLPRLPRGVVADDGVWRPRQRNGAGDHDDVVEAGSLRVMQGPLPQRPAMQHSEQFVLAAGEPRAGTGSKEGGNARHGSKRTSPAEVSIGGSDPPSHDEIMTK